MSPRLTKPGMRSANLTGKLHPKTGEPLEPLGYLKNGQAVWPVLGASSDDPDDPEYTRGGDDDEEDDEDDEDDDTEDDTEDDDDSGKSKKSKKSTKSKKDDDEEDDEDDSRIHKISQQAKRYRLALRAKEKELEDVKTRLQALEDVDKTPDEVANRQISDLKAQNATLAEQARVMTAQLAFFRSNTVTWVDPSDAFALAERAGLFDDLVDEDGTVDERELRRGLRDLAKRKPHLVKKDDDSPKARGRKSKDADEEDEKDDDEEPRSRRSASTQNGRRKGQGSQAADRAALAKRFPVLNRF